MQSTLLKLKTNELVIFLLTISALITTSFGIFVQNELRNVSRQTNVSPAEWTEPYEDGLWSSLLEEWTLKNKNSPSRGREARIIQTVEAPKFHNNQQQSFQKYIPTSEAYITRRVSESIDLETNMRRPQEVMSNVINTSQTAKAHQNIHVQRQSQFNSPREVSETDLYLLGAIEKLVYRVDYMEKRLKRTEQLVYYMMAGNSQKPETDSCPTNFTKIEKNCYHISSVERVDWKTAASKCRSIGASLAEFDSVEKFRNLAAHVLNNQSLRGKDYWIGGLNPGLLWIWSTSARPVNPNANLTTFTNNTESINKVPAKVANQSASKPNAVTGFPEISGDGRCLRLSYNSTIFNYGYTGHDCSAKQHFMCVIIDKTLENEIKRIAKELKFPF